MGCIPTSIFIAFCQPSSAPLNLNLCGSAVGPDAMSLLSAGPSAGPTRSVDRETSRFSIASSSAVDDDDAEKSTAGLFKTQDTTPFSTKYRLANAPSSKRVRDIVHQQQSIVQWKLERRPRPKERTSTERLRSLGMSDELAEVMAAEHGDGEDMATTRMRNSAVSTCVVVSRARRGAAASRAAGAPFVRGGG